MTGTVLVLNLAQFCLLLLDFCGTGRVADYALALGLLGEHVARVTACAQAAVLVVLSAERRYWHTFPVLVEIVLVRTSSTLIMHELLTVGVLLDCFALPSRPELIPCETP